MSEEKIYFAVMKLLTEVEYDSPFDGKKVVCQLGGCEGFIPVYSTMDEAIEQSNNGKYQIIPIKA